MKLFVFQSLFALSFGTIVVTAVISQEHAQILVAIKDRKIINAENTLRFAEGDPIRLRWSTDEPAEVHLHGYDILLRLVPGQSVDMDFEASVPGRFPITTHGFSGEHDHRTLMYLEIYPK